MTIISSILNDTKQVLGLEPDDENFDVDVLMHINSTISRLTDLGVGPDDGLIVIDDSQAWDLLTDSDNGLNRVQSYVYLSVRLLFDPPATAHHMTAMQAQIDKLEWLLNVRMEATIYNDPSTIP